MRATSEAMTPSRSCQLRLDLLDGGRDGAEVVSQRFDGLELRGLVGPLVVDLGQHLLLHVLDEHPEGDGGLLLRVGVLGVEHQHVARARTPEVLVELGDHAVRPELVEVVVGAEALDRLTVDRAGDVDRDVVAVLGGALHRHELARLGPQALDLRVDGGLVGVRARHLHPQPAVAGHRDPGPDLDHCVEDDRSVRLPGGDVDLRRCDDVDVVLPHRLRVVLGQRLAQRLLACRLGPHPRLEDLPGGLPRAEARDPDLLGDAPERRVERLVELHLVDLDAELDLVALEGFDARLHRPGVYRGPTTPSRGGRPAGAQRDPRSREVAGGSGRGPAQVGPSLR
jgi:hypothetical protein